MLGLTPLPIKSDTKNTHTTTTTKQTNKFKQNQTKNKKQKIQTHLILSIKQNEHCVIKHKNSNQKLSSKSQLKKKNKWKKTISHHQTRAKQQTLCSTNCSLVHKTTKIDVTEIRNRNPGVVSSFVLGTRILIGSTIDSIMLNT